NEHVIHHSEGGQAWSVSSLNVSIDPDTPKQRNFSADVVAFDAGADIAVLKINCPVPLPYLSLASGTNTDLGDPITIHGYPLGGRFQKLDGKILRLKPPNQQFSVNVLECIGKAEHGCSGGAVLDASGRVVGVTVAKAHMVMERVREAKVLQQAVFDGVNKAFEDALKAAKE